MIEGFFLAIEGGSGLFGRVISVRVSSVQWPLLGLRSMVHLVISV